MCFRENLTKAVKATHTQYNNPLRREDFKQQETASGEESRSSSCHQPLLPVGHPATRGFPCNVGMTGALLTFLGTNVIISICALAKKCDAEGISSGDPFPRRTHDQVSPPRQATGHGTCFALFKRMLPAGTSDQQVQDGSKENRGSSFHAKMWRRRQA